MDTPREGILGPRPRNRSTGGRRGAEGGGGHARGATSGPEHREHSGQSQQSPGETVSACRTSVSSGLHLRWLTAFCEQLRMTRRSSISSPPLRPRHQPPPAALPQHRLSPDALRGEGKQLHPPAPPAPASPFPVPHKNEPQWSFSLAHSHPLSRMGSRERCGEFPGGLTPLPSARPWPPAFTRKPTVTVLASLVTPPGAMTGFGWER